MFNNQITPNNAAPYKETAAGIFSLYFVIITKPLSFEKMVDSEHSKYHLVSLSSLMKALKNPNEEILHNQRTICLKVMLSNSMLDFTWFSAMWNIYYPIIFAWLDS